MDEKSEEDALYNIAQAIASQIPGATAVEPADILVDAQPFSMIIITNHYLIVLTKAASRRIPLSDPQLITKIREVIPEPWASKKK